MNEKIVLLEGFHAVKHALRFGAPITDIMTVSPPLWPRLAQSLAPDVAALIERQIRQVPESELLAWSRSIHPTGILGLAHRPRITPSVQFSQARSAPMILLDDPRRPGNVGAVIRVAAAANMGGVLSTGELDPWQPSVVRGAAGLHYALPVSRVELDQVEGPIIGFEADGLDIRGQAIANHAVLAFGTEREGLSDALRARCTQVLALPMRAGVSSLNLATSVAAVAYFYRLQQKSTGNTAGFMNIDSPSSNNKEFRHS